MPDALAIATLGLQVTPTPGCPPPAPGSGSFSVARHLAETILPNSAVGTFGVDIFENKEPAEKHATLPTVVCYDLSGPDPIISADKNNFEEFVVVRVISIPDTPAPAQAQMQVISQLIVAGISDTIDTTQYTGSYRIGGLVPTGYDTNNRIVWTGTFRFFRNF